MTSSAVVLATVASIAATAAPAFARESPIAGRIKVVSGSAFILRDGTQLPARAGDVVYEADALKTTGDASIGVTLRDDTRFSLGPNSEVQLRRFVYAPADSNVALVLTFVRGVAAYVSGRIAKLAPDAIRLETPAAILGVRGTTLAIRVGP